MPSSVVLWSTDGALLDHTGVGLPVLDGENDSAVFGPVSALELSTSLTPWLREGEMLESHKELVFDGAAGLVIVDSVLVLVRPSISVSLCLSVDTLGAVDTRSGFVESVMIIRVSLLEELPGSLKPWDINEETGSHADDGTPEFGWTVRSIPVSCVFELEEIAGFVTLWVGKEPTEGPMLDDLLVCE